MGFIGMKGKIIGATVVLATAYALKHSETGKKISAFTCEKSASALRSMAEKELTKGNIARHDALVKAAEALESHQAQSEKITIDFDPYEEDE